MGFVVVVVLVLFVGWLSSLFVVEKLVSVFDTVLEKADIVCILVRHNQFLEVKKKIKRFNFYVDVVGL